MRASKLLRWSLVLVLAPALAACSEDRAASPAGPTSDASSDDASLAAEAGSVVPVLSSSSMIVYLGNVVALDASSSTGSGPVTYAWRVTAAPEGSAITTASLSDPASATPSFTPDRLGRYALELGVEASGGTSSATIEVTVVDPPIFYVQTDDTVPGVNRASVNVVGASASDGGAVACVESDAGTYESIAGIAATVGADVWEAPAGEPSRIVFVSERRAGADVTSVLAATTSSGTCASEPNALDELPGEPFGTRAFEQPRLSPDGRRVVYVRTEAGRSRIATVGFDGTNKHIVAPLRALEGGAPDPDAGLTAAVSPRPTWVDAQTVAWLQDLDATTWQVVKAADQEGATPSVVVKCTGARPGQFEVLPSGEVLVVQTTGTGGSTATNLFVYPVTPGTSECGTPRNLSNVVSDAGASLAADFSLSPDKKLIAYVMHDDATHVTRTMVVPVDGSSAPRAVAGDLGGAKRGPRWVGSGAFLSWAMASSELDAGLSGDAIVVVPSDGGDVRAVASGPPGTSTYAISNGRCSFGPAVGPSVGLTGIAAVALLRLVRRRRR